MKSARFWRFSGTSRLKPGHGTRTVAESRDQARADVTIMTSLLEARLLTGSDKLFGQLGKAINARGVWSSTQFYRAKVREQEQRNAEYGDTASNLEPDVKNGPGGLRDLHTVQWILKRRFGSTGAGNPGRTGADLRRAAGRAAPGARFPLAGALRPCT